MFSLIKQATKVQNTRRLRAAPSLLKRAGVEIIMLSYNKKLKQWTQELRKNATPQENKLWYEFLRKHPCRFTRQKPIDNYIVDFLCPSKKLVIEIDGSQHFTDDGLKYDGIRTDLLMKHGLHVMRFTNTQINTSFNAVCEEIQKYIDSYSK